MKMNIASSIRATRKLTAHTPRRAPATRSSARSACPQPPPTGSTSRLLSLRCRSRKLQKPRFRPAAVFPPSAGKRYPDPRPVQLRPHNPKPLTASTWLDIVAETTAFAQAQINRRLWRRRPHGILPEGHDSQSLASESLLHFLHRTSFDAVSTYQPIKGSTSRESVSTYQLSTASRILQSSLNRSILREVDRLHHLKENWLLISEHDLPQFRDASGNSFSPLHLIPDPSPSPDAALIEAETDRERTAFLDALHHHLDDDPELQTLLAQLREGFAAPRHLAAQLHLPVRKIDNLLKRLRRRSLSFIKSPSFSSNPTPM